MSHISERADRFARKFVKDKPVPDTRSMDEKMAEFHKNFGRNRVQSARDKVKKVRDAS
jgi:hypothetical protein